VHCCPRPRLSDGDRGDGKGAVWRACTAMMSLGDLLVALACGLGQEFQPGQRRGHGVPPPLAVPDGRAQVLRGTAAVERLGDQGGTGAVGGELVPPPVPGRVAGGLSPATRMGPLFGVFCHEHGTTWLPVMGPPGVPAWGS
jgi:hypothetical protein